MRAQYVPKTPRKCYISITKYKNWIYNTFDTPTQVPTLSIGKLACSMQESSQ